jgi:holdfast attachment protein HfaA
MGNDTRRTRLGGPACGLGLVLLLSTGGAACAQSASSSLSGFSRGPSSFESPVNVSTKDANGNMTIVDGVMQAAQGSIFSNLASMGVATSTSGASSASASGAGGVGSATAIGNNLSVVVNGDNNTVIVNATQTNNGTVTATTVLNGKVNLDGSQ